MVGDIREGIPTALDYLINAVLSAKSSFPRWCSCKRGHKRAQKTSFSALYHEWLTSQDPAFCIYKGKAFDPR